MAGSHTGNLLDNLEQNEVNPQSMTGGAAVNGSGVDMASWEGVGFQIHVGVITGVGTLAARLEEATDSTFTTPTNIANAALVNITSTANNSVSWIIASRSSISKRFVRCVVTQATNTVVAGVTSFRFRRSGLLPPTRNASQTVIV